MTLRRFSRRFLSLYTAAGAADAPAEQLRRLAFSRWDRIRMRVAENPNTPPDVLAHLAKDSCHDVRVAVATNPACPLDVVQMVAQDEDIVVRHGLAQSINVPASVLQVLADDDNAWVRGEALKTLEILRTWTQQELADARAQIKIDQACWSRLVGRKLGDVRELYAKKAKDKITAANRLSKRLKRFFMPRHRFRSA
jgi:hypothetical protein